jgi:trehalose-6-phosphate synthase
MKHPMPDIDLKDEMDQLVGQINGRFSTPRWSPIRYIFGTIPQVKWYSSYYILYKFT